MDAQASGSETVSMGNEERVREIVGNAVLGLWDVVNELTRLRPARRERFRVSIFGSARVMAGSFAYEETKRVARALAEMGCDIVTGGGPGLMQAANEGAAGVTDRNASIGIRIALPFEQDVNEFVNQAYEHRTFFTRLHQFVISSDAFVVAPGGIGTVLEMLMIWQLLQVGHIQGVPLVLVGPMWPGLVDWARREMLRTTPPLANERDIEIPRCVAAGDDAIVIIRQAHERWRAAAAK